MCFKVIFIVHCSSQTISLAIIRLVHIIARECTKHMIAREIGCLEQCTIHMILKHIKISLKLFALPVCYIMDTSVSRFDWPRAPSSKHQLENLPDGSTELIPTDAHLSLLFPEYKHHK